jgi:hypothetical protein
VGSGRVRLKSAFDRWESRGPQTADECFAENAIIRWPASRTAALATERFRPRRLTCDLLFIHGQQIFPLRGPA